MCVGQKNENDNGQKIASIEWVLSKYQTHVKIWATHKWKKRPQHQHYMQHRQRPGQLKMLILCS